MRDGMAGQEEARAVAACPMHQQRSGQETERRRQTALGQWPGRPSANNKQAALAGDWPLQQRDIRCLLLHAFIPLRARRGGGRAEGGGGRRGKHRKYTYLLDELDDTHTHYNTYNAHLHTHTHTHAHTHSLVKATSGLDTWTPGSG